MEKKFEPTPKMKEKIEAKVREFKEKEARGELKPLKLEELDAVAGGGGLARPELDPNKVINGWNYTDLYNILCWTYESYYDPADLGIFAKDLTIGLAMDIIPSHFWVAFFYCAYPAFITEPMWRLWCPNSYGM